MFAQRTIAPKPFADIVSGVIEANPDDAKRSDVQSFDFRTLLRVQDTHPDLPLVALFGDTPVGSGVDEDGTNLQPGPGGAAQSPWLAGMEWPYRSTALTVPFCAQASGGFEGMAESPDGRRLLPALEKPLIGDTSHTTTIAEYDLRKHQWTGRPHRRQGADPRRAEDPRPQGCRCSIPRTS